MGEEEGGKKAPPTSFSLLTSTNIKISPQNFLTFSFKPFTSPKLLNLNHPSEKWFFWSNPYKIEVMRTSLTETLELPNSGHMPTSTM